MSKESKSIFVALLVVAVIVLGVYLWKKGGGQGEVSRENVEVSKIDLSVAQGQDRVPGGFPAGLPLETENVSESYTQDYVDRGVVLYGFTYKTEKTATEVLASYKLYIEDNQYVIQSADERLDNARPSFIQARSGDDELLVTVNPNNGETTVQVVYTQKKTQ